MLSTFPATFPSDLFGNHFPTFESGFSHSDINSHDPPFVFPPLPPLHDEPVPVGQPTPQKRVVTSPNLVQEPVYSSTGSDNRVSVNPNSGLDEANHSSPKYPVSRSDDTNRTGSVMDERKRRRMVSNRESARRSRMRKQKHLENLRNQVSRLRVENRELMNRLQLVVHQDQYVRNQNDQLRHESTFLRKRLWEIRQVLMVRQLQHHLNPSAWPCNNVTCTNGEQIISHHSLIA